MKKLVTDIFLVYWQCLPKHCGRPGTPLHDNGVSWWKCGFFVQDTATIVQKWFEKCDALAPKFPPSSVQLWDVLYQQVWFTVSPPHNQDLKDQLQASWWQLPQKTICVSEEGIPRWVGIILADIQIYLH